MKKLLPLILILFAASSIVFASPIQLECEVSREWENISRDEATPILFSIDIDEKAEEIIHITSDGFSELTLGVFSTNTINYKLQHEEKSKTTKDTKIVTTKDIVVNRENLHTKYEIDTYTISGKTYHKSIITPLF